MCTVIDEAHETRDETDERCKIRDYESRLPKDGC